MRYSWDDTVAFKEVTVVERTVPSLREHHCEARRSSRVCYLVYLGLPKENLSVSLIHYLWGPLAHKWITRQGCGGKSTTVLSTILPLREWTLERLLDLSENQFYPRPSGIEGAVLIGDLCTGWCFGNHYSASSVFQVFQQCWWVQWEVIIFIVLVNIGCALIIQQFSVTQCGRSSLSFGPRCLTWEPRGLNRELTEARIIIEKLMTFVTVWQENTVQEGCFLSHRLICWGLSIGNSTGIQNSHSSPELDRHKKKQRSKQELCSHGIKQSREGGALFFCLHVGKYWQLHVDVL